jgi:hypothetical protein
MCKFIIDTSNDCLVTDKITGLIWCRFGLGQRWQNNAVTGTLKMFERPIALNQPGLFNNSQNGYVNNTGYYNWRMPTCDELKGLIDLSQGNPGTLVDPTIFPSNNGYTFWASNEQAPDVVFFGQHLASNGDSDFWYAVQLVRDQ